MIHDWTASSKQDTTAFMRRPLDSKSDLIQLGTCNWVDAIWIDAIA